MSERPVMSDKPVFLDETGSRWRLSRIVLFGIATALLMLPIVLALSILKVGVLSERSNELQQIIIGSPREAGYSP
jgi:hypothetical protein